MGVRASSTNRAAAITENLTPIIVLRTDDANASWETLEAFPTLGDPETLQNAIGYCTELALPLTMAVPPYELDVQGMSGSTMVSIIEGGLFEIASHAYQHPAIPVGQPIAGYATSLADSLTALSALGVTGELGFVEPGDWHNAADEDSSCRGDADRRSSLLGAPWNYVQDHFAWGMGYFPRGWGVGRRYYRYGLPFDQEMDNVVVAMRTAAKITALLDVVAASPGLIFIPLFHAIVADATDPATAPYAMQVSNFKAMMDKVFALRAAGKIRVLTMTQAMSEHHVNKYTNNLLADPSITQSSLGADFPNGPWHGNVTISATGGRDGGRCFQAAYAQYVDHYLWLEPGTYTWSWWQKKLSGSDGAHDTTVYVQELHARAAAPGGAPVARTILTTTRDNVDTAQWEKQSVTFRVELGQTTFNLELAWNAGTLSNWLWDGIDLRMVPPTRTAR